MKVINENSCYVQVDDLIYALRNDYNKFPMGLYYNVINNYGTHVPSDMFIEVTDENQIKYIKETSLIYDYDLLNSKSVEELEELCDQIIRESNIRRSRIVLSSMSKKPTEGYRIISDPFVRLNISHEKNNRRYLLSQVKSVIASKKGEKDLNIPSRSMVRELK